MPLVAAGVSAGVGLYNAYKARQQAKQLQQPLTDAANTQAAQGRQLFATGLPWIQQAGSYYSRLVNGNRGEMTAAVAPELSATSDLYRGAASGLERSGVQGANRDVARANLGRDEAGRLSGIIAGVRPAAAAALTNLGTAATGMGQAGTAGAAGSFTNLLGAQQRSNEFQTGENTANFSQFGELFAQLLKSMREGKSLGSLGSSGALTSF